MGILACFKMRCLRRRPQGDLDDASPGALSRTSTIQSQTMDLVCHQTMLKPSGSGTLRMGSSALNGQAANWECIEYPNGSDYLGWTYAGKREGPGKIQNGELVYDGQWQCDLPHGNGLFSAENTVYEGHWDYGLPHGHGVAMLPDGAKYVGEWRDGHCEGPGKLATEDGSVYVGAFSDGLPNGEGLMATAEGVRVLCNFIDGAPFGVGEIEWPDGTKYVGTIIEGLPHGLGRLTNETHVTLGLWKKGVLETRLRAHGPIPDAVRDDPAVRYLMCH